MSNGYMDYEINKELGECYLFMGELEKAQEYYSKAASCNGVHPDPYVGLATVAMQQGDLPKAYALYKKAAAIEPDDKSLTGMALVEVEDGKNDEAFTHCLGALDKNPQNMVALFTLVQLGHNLNRLEEVVPYLETVYAADSTNDDIRYCLAGCLAKLDKKSAARSHVEAILQGDPDNEGAQELLAQLAGQGVG